MCETSSRISLFGPGRRRRVRLLFVTAALMCGVSPLFGDGCEPASTHRFADRGLRSGRRWSPHRPFAPPPAPQEADDEQNVERRSARAALKTHKRSLFLAGPLL